MKIKCNTLVPFDPCASELETKAHAGMNDQAQ